MVVTMAMASIVDGRCGGKGDGDDGRNRCEDENGRSNLDLEGHHA